MRMTVTSTTTGDPDHEGGMETSFEPEFPTDADELTQLSWHAGRVYCMTGLEVEVGHHRVPDMYSLSVEYREAARGEVTSAPFDQAVGWMDGLVSAFYVLTGCYGNDEEEQ